MSRFLKVFEAQQSYMALLQNLENNNTPVDLVGVSQIHKAHIVASIFEKTDKSVVLLTADDSLAQRLTEEINDFLEGREKALCFTSREFVFNNIEGASREYELARISVLSELTTRKKHILVASVQSAMQFTLPKQELKNHTIEIKPGQEIAIDKIVNHLVGAGYVRRDNVDGLCQFSVRGGILDVFPAGEKAPVRIEFWGDEIDTIANFSLETQRREKNLKKVMLTPAEEVLTGGNLAFAQKLKDFKNTIDQKKNKVFLQDLQGDIDRLEGEISLGAKDKYLPLCYEKPATVLDYLEDYTLFFSEPGEAFLNAQTSFDIYSEEIKSLFEQNKLVKGLDNFQKDPSYLKEVILKNKTAYLNTFIRPNKSVPPKEIIQFTGVSFGSWNTSFANLLEEVKGYLSNDYMVVVLGGTPKASKILAEDLAGEGLTAGFTENIDKIEYNTVKVMSGALAGGFAYNEGKIAFLTVSKYKNKPRKKAKKKTGKETITTLEDITKGDLLVHVSHGIGRFDGIRKMDVGGVQKDYIKISYRGSDVLYVPVTQLDLVSKYIGPKDDSRVKLNKLHSGEWQKTKQRVYRAVKDMADELTQLYAKRMQETGYGFSEDTDWQNDFENRFEFEETEDQLRCIREIKRDMEKPAPMDRLLCGDVGFGKTEVALRAAFKAVMDSKQVAFLVPTTILAWQHYQTMLKRFEGFPITVELLSRFRTPKQQKEIVNKLRTGEVDIVVGTHRLVQKDIKFKDLGLAIIDEEQRFGVAHKEKFKQFFAGVDMLTLSATPIPRTLNMAMVGIRDMSVIEEAPVDRQPVQTYVVEQDDQIIAEAIRKEKNRGGQVYYIHNRIETIEVVSQRIRAMLPDINVEVAHGRMTETQLSNIWTRLLDGDIDVLICTTIIETGVDVANCNTLIVEDSDHLGLAQLYQLRGRVGRSTRKAYAYLTFKKGKVLTDIATKRLNAVREFTNFGSGFKIAMRDLEIRGAGSILGGRQHGHMEAVGYDMYIRLLNEAVSVQQGEKEQMSTKECLVDIRLDAFIPEDYIGDIATRIDIYKKIAALRSENDAMDLIDELIDRFGDTPQSVKGLIDVSLLRNLAMNIGIYEIVQRAETLYFYVEVLPTEKMQVLMKEYSLGKVLVNASAKPYIAASFDKKFSPIQVMREVLGALNS